MLFISAITSKIVSLSLPCNTGSIVTYRIFSRCLSTTLGIEPKFSTASAVLLCLPTDFLPCSPVTSLVIPLPSAICLPLGAGAFLGKTCSLGNICLRAFSDLLSLAAPSLVSSNTLCLPDIFLIIISGLAAAYISLKESPSNVACSLVKLSSLAGGVPKAAASRWFSSKIILPNLALPACFLARALGSNSSGSDKLTSPKSLVSLSALSNSPAK